MRQVSSYHQTYILVFLFKRQPTTTISMKKLSTGKIPRTLQHSLSISASSMAQCLPVRYTQITLREEGHWIQQETPWPSKKLAYAVDEHLLQVFWVKSKWNGSNAIISFYLLTPKILLGCCFVFIPPRFFKKALVCHYLSRALQAAVGFILVFSPRYQSAKLLVIAR